MINSQIKVQEKLVLKQRESQNNIEILEITEQKDTISGANEHAAT